VALGPAGMNLLHATGTAAWQSVCSTSMSMSCRVISLGRCR
jgi:hypothetical protein